jgi:hypothetical protein
MRLALGGKIAQDLFLVGDGGDKSDPEIQPLAEGCDGF